MNEGTVEVIGGNFVVSEHSAGEFTGYRDATRSEIFRWNVNQVSWLLDVVDNLEARLSVLER